MEEISKNIKTEYEQYLDDNNVREVRTSILKAIIKISELHAQKGVLIEL